MTRQYVIELLVSRLAPEPRAYGALFALRMVDSESRDVCWLHRNTPMSEVRYTRDGAQHGRCRGH